MRKYSHLFLILFFTVAVSCIRSEEGNGPKTIKIDLDEAVEIAIQPERTVGLATSDSSLIYEIGNMAVVDELWVIQSRNLIKTFGSDGRYIGNVSKEGQGPGEYLFIRQFWNDGDTLKLLDSQNRCVFAYKPNGDFLGIVLDLTDNRRQFCGRRIHYESS